MVGVVLNLDDTVAVTHNYVKASNFAKVWRSVRSGRFSMSRPWLDATSKDYPHLVELR